MTTNDQQPCSNEQVETPVAQSTVAMITVPTMLSLTSLTLSFWNNVLPLGDQKDDSKMEPTWGGRGGWGAPQ